MFRSLADVHNVDFDQDLRAGGRAQQRRGVPGLAGRNCRDGRCRTL